ncbi:A/G-specific adenine glycosylase [Rhodocyclaceae bacterium SMB388]
MSEFARSLIHWHAEHGRHDLPWQNTSDPYRIWLSEIMLQQTQVDTVIPYYRRFLARFPDLAALADAPGDDVLALWSGLGYYARARNLHRAAQAVLTDYGGRFPDDVEAIASLPGIGRSTAAAIATFAFGQRHAILDGNVKRVLCRIFGVDGYPGEKKVEDRLWALAESLLPERADATGIYIQAQMDLGATLCTRARPACMRCPLAQECIAARDGRVAELPTPRPRKATPQRESRVALVLANGPPSGDGAVPDVLVLLERRPPSGIWGGLLSLPELPDSASGPGQVAHWLASHLGVAGDDGTELAPVRHAFTHFQLTLRPLRFDIDQNPHKANRVGEDRLVWLRLDELDRAGLPAPIRRMLESLRTPTLFDDRRKDR